MLVSIQIKHCLNKTSMLMLGKLNDSLKIYIELEEELGIIVMALNDVLNFNISACYLLHLLDWPDSVLPTH